MARFDRDFLLGAATAAHQVEGNNRLCDTWAQENMPFSSYQEPSGLACDHYSRYREDIRLMAEAGLNAYRFSLEWARIEPEEGRFDEKELEHYRSVIRCCRENGIEPIVTLHHFTSPVWLIRKGGWEADSTVEDFARYAGYIAEHLGSELKYVCTINEANMGIQIAAVARQVLQSMIASGKVQVGVNLEDMMKGRPETIQENLRVFGTEKPAVFVSPRSEHGDEIVMRAHAAARTAFREAAPHVKIGWTLSLHDVQSAPGGMEKAEEEWRQEFTHYLPAMAGDDFLGVQNYSRTIIGPDGSLPVPEGHETTQMGYEYYPQGLAHVLRRVSKDFPGDLMVTENGIAVSDDTRRQAFIEEATRGVAQVMEEGVRVKGYLYWSLLDNFEWQKGFSMTFGLIGVDRETMKRCPKGSLYQLGSLRSDVREERKENGQEMQESVMKMLIEYSKREKEKKLVNYRQQNAYIQKGKTLFTGSSLMENFPITEYCLNEGLPIAYNRGIGGYTTDEFLAAVDTVLLDAAPSRLFINIGTNDIAPRRDGQDWFEHLRGNYRKICEIIRDRLPGTCVYMMAYYPVNAEAPLAKNNPGMKVRTNANIAKANRMVEELAAEFGFTYLDVNDGLKDEEGNLLMEHTRDGIHFDSEAYRTVFERLRPYLV